MVNNFRKYVLKIILICFFLFIMIFPCCAQPKSTTYPQDVSIIQLIATPEKYEGVLIRVIGYLRLEFEGNDIYLSQEDFINGILKNALGVDVNKNMMKYFGKNYLGYCLIEGVFDSTSKGHMNACSGTIKNITRFMKWRFKRKLDGSLEKY